MRQPTLLKGPRDDGAMLVWSGPDEKVARMVFATARKRKGQKLQLHKSISWDGETVLGWVVIAVKK